MGGAWRSPLPRPRRNGGGGAVTASGTKGAGRPGVIEGGVILARIRALIPGAIIIRIRGRILVAIIVRIRGPILGPTIAIIPAAIVRR